MNGQNDSAVARAVEALGWVVLLVLLAAVMWWFGGLMANGIDNLLHTRRLYDWTGARLPGIELAIVPLTAVAASRLRFGVDRILALRGSRVGPWLPLLMAASLFGLVAYLVWTWTSPPAAYWLQPEFGRLRRLGVVLLAGFSWVWLPLFPRVTATLAGMIAGTCAVCHHRLLVRSRVHARTRARGNRTIICCRPDRCQLFRNVRLGRGRTLAAGPGADWH